MDHEPTRWMGDARTGQIIWSAPSCGCDNGRGVAADIWSGNPGAEAWSSSVGGLRSGTNGNQVASRKPGSQNFVIWWDGDAQRELLDGSKATPALSADILGDWREEVIWDRQYRVAVAWQNTAYNQPPHASFATP